jgi:ABC-type oligopeptide transport system ATPase subunit
VSTGTESTGPESTSPESTSPGSSSPESTLRIDGVSKLFRASGLGGGMTQALRKVSFDIKAGEVVTLIGESGSGKTTLGRIVLRLTQPTSGRIVFDGADVSDYKRAGLRQYYRQVQGVFQDPFSSYNPIYKADRVFELLRDVYFPELTQQAWDAKIESALHAVALNPGDVLNKYPHQLSGGQQQRMLIARALLLEVKLLVADEIISMLDASTRVDVLNLLVSLKKAGLAILFITHDLSLGNYLSDRTVILRHGAIVETGPTVMVFGNPQHSYTKMLLSAVPQLHSRWQPIGAEQAAARAASGESGRAAAAAAASFRLRAGRRSGQDLAAVLEPPALTEREPGHLVAAE